MKNNLNIAYQVMKRNKTKSGMYPHQESAEKPSMMGMDSKSIVDGMRKKMADGGQVDSDVVTIDPVAAGAISDSFKKATHYAEGGEVDTMDDDFLSEDQNPMPEEEEPKKKRMEKIMADLHAKHFGK